MTDADRARLRAKIVAAMRANAERREAAIKRGDEIDRHLVSFLDVSRRNLEMWRERLQSKPGATLASGRESARERAVDCGVQSWPCGYSWRIWGQVGAEASLPLVGHIVRDMVFAAERAGVYAGIVARHKRIGVPPDSPRAVRARRERGRFLRAQNACVDELAALGVLVQNTYTGEIWFPGVSEDGYIGYWAWLLDEHRVERFVVHESVAGDEDWIS